MAIQETEKKDDGSQLLRREELNQMANHLHQIFEEALDEDGEMHNQSILENRQVSNLEELEEGDLDQIEQNYSVLIDQIMHELSNDPQSA